MAKRTKNRVLTAVISIFALVVGLVCGFFANIITTLPDSYQIPAAREKTTHVHSLGQIDKQVVSTGDLSIHFLELGNKYTGDCTLIKSGDTEILIDAGSKATSVNTIKSYVNEYCTDGVLEYVVVTHAHQDHYAGFATKDFKDSIFNFFEVETIIQFAGTNQNPTKGLYKNYLANIAEENATVFTALECVNQSTNSQGKTAKREYVLNQEKDIYFEILYQKFYDNTTADENDYSVCLQVVHGEKKFLFTGDLEAEGEESLVEESRAGGKNAGRLGKVELFKAGHHGSKTSTSDALLEIIDPSVICVCCCAGSPEYTKTNNNQFPTQEFITRVYTNNPNTQIFVTSLCVNYANDEFTSMNGNIVVVSTGTANIQTMFSASDTELRHTDWFKNNRTFPQTA